MSRRVIGIDAGGSKLLAGVVDEQGDVLFRTLRAWPSERTREAVLAEFAAVVAEARAQDDSVDAIGCGIPATVDVSTGATSACAHLPLAGFGFGEWLAAESGLPSFVANDATVAMLAEHRRGGARGTLDAVLLTIGTGIGGGIVSRGHIVHGASGAAGEPGHMTIDADGPPCPGDCPGRGCLEAYVSGPALAALGLDYAARADDYNLGRTLAAKGELTAADVIDAARAGDPGAHEALQRVGQKLGAGIASLLNLLEPEVVLIGGGMGAHAGALLLEPAERTARERALEPAASQARIELAELGADAGMLGAALFALELGHV